MTITDLIHDQLEVLLEDFVEVARDQLPAAKALSDTDLRNGARSLLLAIADDIARAQTASYQRSKSEGGQPHNAPDLTHHAQEHAVLRLEQGFTLDQLVAEYRALRASVARHVERGSYTMAELVRVNEAIDQALLESIRGYGARLEHARELFLGVLGHDLRNPLGAIRMSAEVILHDERLGGPATVAAVRLKNSATRMARLIEDLIDFTRTRLGGAMPIRPERMELGAALRDVVDELSAMHAGRQLLLQAQGEVWGRWDPGRIAQAVSNLVGNAIQYGEPGRPVTVGLGRADGAACITVHNEGAPIPPESLGAIFDPMVRLASPEFAGTEQAPSGSVGLGLYVCREIVHAHGGRIEVESAPQRGTTFIVTLPAPQQDPQPAPMAPPPAPSS